MILEFSTFKNKRRKSQDVGTENQGEAVAKHLGQQPQNEDTKMGMNFKEYLDSMKVAKEKVKEVADAKVEELNKAFKQAKKDFQNQIDAIQSEVPVEQLRTELGMFEAINQEELLHEETKQMVQGAIARLKKQLSVGNNAAIALKK